MNRKVQNEYADGDGYWIELAPGWTLYGDHQIHENSKTAARRLLPSVTPCDCTDCQKQPGYKDTK